MNREDDIFADALELSGAERTAFLDRACAGDAALRTRVEALLSGHEAARGFLDKPLTPRPALAGEPEAGDVIGRYTLLRKIGEGGYGVVWLAEQGEPLRRLVALKVIKLGMDTQSVIVRFEGERQTLALMAHPDIAQVYDAGATATGRPFFVMEYVEGVPITRFCDQVSLPLAERLELFARVCVAVQHAHQKGIIHRDLKPSNILVTVRDGLPAPKIIDFGIAKATQGRLTEQTFFTDAGQLVGTPAYMSPEQAELREHDIDTRSDIYSLGVVLYELLAGRPPYDPKSLQQAGMLEVRRIIREVDPPRPSTVIATLGNADRDTVARQRRAAAPQLTSVLQGDLDWIVMCCLEKNRDQRYGTASDLAEDIRRHLRQEPVLARPLQLRYRMRKFIARHRGACISVAAVALALIGGTIVSVRQAVRATRAERQAAAERDLATSLAAAEAAARADAQRRQEQAEDLLTFMLGDFRTELSKIGRLELLDSVGAKAMSYFNALDPRDLTDTALTRQAKALTQIGEIRMDQARYPEAAEAFQTAQTRAATLAARHPKDGDMLFERAQAEFWIGEVARRRGDAVTVRKWFLQYRDSAIALVALEGSTLRAQLEVIYGHHNLATLDFQRGNFAEAETSFLAERDTLDALLAVRPEDAQLLFNRADVAPWLGMIAEYTGRYALAAANFADQTARYQELNRRSPAVARWKLELAQSLTFRGRIATLIGNPTEAEKFYNDARGWHDSLVAQDSKNRRWLVAQQSLILQQAILLLVGNEAAAAKSMMAGSRDKLEELVAAEPSSSDYKRVLANACRLEARLLLAQNRLADANAAAARARELGELLLHDAAAETWVAPEYAQSAILSGRIALEGGDAAAAQAHWRRAMEVLQAGSADSRDWRVLEPLAQALILSGRSEEARPLAVRLQSFGFRPIDPWSRSVLEPILPDWLPSHPPTKTEK